MKSFYAIRTYARFIKPHAVSFFSILGVFALSSAAICLVPYIIGVLVQAATTGNNEAVWMSAWILVILSSLHDILWRGGELLHRKYINPIGFHFETELFRQVIDRPYPYFVDKLSGKVSGSISAIGAELRTFSTQVFYSYIPQVFGIVTMAILLASVNWQTLVIFVVGIAAMILVGRHTIKNSIKHEAIAADNQSTKSGHIVDSIANFASVKSFHKESTEREIVKKSISATLHSSQEAYLWGVVFWGSMSFFIRHLIWPATILINIALFFDGQVSLGQLATLLSTILLFSSTVWGLIWEMSQFNLQMSRIEEAYRYLFGKQLLSLEKSRRKGTSKAEIKHSIELHNLSFSYPDKPDVSVIKNINLSIKKGERIGIVGKSGGGKTTLVKLLLGYYNVPEEMLLLDGAPVSRDHLAHLVSYVPQDTSLFHRSIAENIGYAADKNVSRDEIIDAAKKAHAHDFITKIEDGYEAHVGERGVKLSGGQRQRIAIARAILKDSPLLILDEATSALDSESEQHIQQALLELMNDRTAIVIAHRLSTIQKMDRIIVLDEGKIKEQGSHDELLRKNGVYSTLWKHQSGGFIKE